MAFGNETEEINRKYIKLRYKFLPYLYDMMHKCEENGAPIIRPLLYDYQNDKKTYEINDEFLFGDNILVSPVVEQGSRQKLVYLPEGNNWIDYWTGTEFEGGQYIIKEAPLDICPIFIKSGSLIPAYDIQNDVGEKSLEELELNIYLGSRNSNLSYIHTIDDGETFKYRDGEYNQYTIEIRNTDKIYVSIRANEYMSANFYKNIKLKIYNGNNKEVILNSDISAIYEMI